MSTKCCVRLPAKTLCWSFLVVVITSSLVDCLTCEALDKVAVPYNMSCGFDVQYATLGRFTCQLINGYHRLGDTFANYLYKKIEYVLDGPPTEVNHSRCFYKSRYTIRKILSRDLTRDIPITDGDFVLESGLFKEFVINSLLSEGFESLDAEYDPEALSNWGILDTHPNCSSCDVPVRLEHRYFSEESYRTSITRARKIALKFNPVYIEMSKFFFPLLEKGSLLEELVVSGGWSWNGLEKMLPSLPLLRLLDLSDTGLSGMEQENFQAIPNLQELRLSHNAFQQVPEGISILSNLTMLDLSWNPLSTERLVEVLSPLKNLQRLLLSNASLHSMDALLPLLAPLEDNRPYAVLLGLDLSFCRLQSVDTDTARAIFRRQTELRNLSLAGNPLGHIPADLFQSLARLSTLNLSRTEIASPPGLLLAPGITLSVLDLSHNLLTSPTGTLSQGTALALTLSGNPLRPWDDQTAFLGVRSLDLSNCSLSELTAPMLRSFDSSTVDLTDNLLDCAACSVPVLRRWLQEHPTLISPAPLRCSLPPAQMGRSVMGAAWSEAACRDNTALIIGASLGLLLALFLLVTLLTYRYRFEVRYILHLVRVNRTPNKTEDGDYQYDAFVCYSGSDRLWVLRELLPRLEGGLEGYNLCLHERDFILGSFISHNIVNCIQSSRRTIVVLTNNFVKSQWCQWELEVASHRLLEGTRDFLILIELERLERRHLPRHLRLLMDTRTFLEWPSRECAPEGVWRRLKVAMGPSLKQAGAPETDA